jgi:hypothetical protein
MLHNSLMPATGANNILCRQTDSHGLTLRDATRTGRQS